MDANSSREESVVKTRKPYTITKQREKWTEVEHIKFVDALKLYGRDWQRIEGYVGTKTAVQIRSHAQKFFIKSEKEANMKRGPFGQARDFEIPPPRPKRKPNSPYPRRNGAGPLSPFVEAMDEKISKSPSTSFCSKQATDIENNAAWKIRGMKDNYEDRNCSEVLNLFQDAPSSSFNGFPPLKIHMKDNTTIQGSSMSFDVNKDMKGNVSGQLKRTCVNSQAISAQKEVDDVQSDQRYTKNVPIDFMKRNGVRNVPATTVANAIPSTSGMIKTTQSSLGVLPNFSQLPSNPDDYRSLINAYIMLTLLQNPAVHAAASVAASIDSSSSETLHGRIPSSTNPSMAAIAAATVSAAAAWWATQGLLPNYPSPHTDFKLAPDDKKEEREGTFQNSLVIDQKNADPEPSEAPRVQLPNFKSLTFSPSSDLGVSRRGELMDHAKTNNFKPLSSNGVHDSDKARNKKKPDRSSCGSNTPSSSEVETNPVLIKNQDEKESDKVRLNSPPIGEKNACRARSSASMNESWKEVSEEGRLAFQALFTREIMPQSFALTHAKELVAMTEDKGKEAISELPAVDLNMKASTSEPTNLYHREGFCVASGFKPYKRCSVEAKKKRTTGGDDARKCFASGFKPYKRCSVDAKEKRTTGGDDARKKKFHLEGFCVTSGFKPYKRCSVEDKEKRTTGGDDMRKCVASGFKPYKRCSVEAEEKRTKGGDDRRKKKIRLEGGTSI